MPLSQSYRATIATNLQFYIKFLYGRPWKVQFGWSLQSSAECSHQIIWFSLDPTAKHCKIGGDLTKFYIYIKPDAHNNWRVLWGKHVSVLLHCVSSISVVLGCAAENLNITQRVAIIPHCGKFIRKYLHSVWYAQTREGWWLVIHTKLKYSSILNLNLHSLNCKELQSSVVACYCYCTQCYSTGLAGLVGVEFH